MKCAYCGGPIGHGIIPHDTPENILCDNCGMYLYTCKTCGNYDCGVERALNGGSCPFPPVVQMETQMGGMFMSSPQINPRLVDVYCHDCKCREDKRCVAHTTYACNNYKLKVNYYE